MMGKIKPIFFILLGISLFLMFSNEVQAADTDIVINEAMPDPTCPSDLCEWVELKNNGDSAVDLNGWTIDGKIISDPSAVIGPHSFLVVTKNLIEFGKIASDINVPVIQVAIGLTNTADSIDLQKNGYLDQANWSSSKTDVSYERLDSTKAWDNNNLLSLDLGGTPGEENSVNQLAPPKKPMIFPISVTAGSEIIFNFEKEENVSYKIIISQNVDMSGPLSLDDIGTLESGTYYWQVVATNRLYETKSDSVILQINEPIYSDAIYISELYPDPSTGEEWIELYNNSPEIVDLKNWVLEDEGLKQYKIVDSFRLEPFGFAVIPYSDSKITLNNNGDFISLYNPNLKLVASSPKYLSGQKGWSFARAPDGIWNWTTQPTPGEKNSIVSPFIAVETGGTDEEIKVPINDEPIKIETGEVDKYRDYLVGIAGEVTRTSGNTFYLDDGSGEVKVYIQDKTGIDKPKMYVGDTFEIFGIVNLYRGIYRILPQKQSDISLIKHPQNILKTKSNKSSKIASAATALSASVLSAKASEDSKMSSPSTTKTPLWIQLVEALVAMAVLIFVVLILKILTIKKNKPIGYNFGDDET